MRATIAMAYVLTACADGTRAGCDALRVPDGFCATEFARNTGPVRHLAAAAGGVVYAGVWREGQRGGGVLALRDTNDDGRADMSARFGTEGGSGIALRDSMLYLGTWSTIQRFLVRRGSLQPARGPEVIVSGMPETEHGARSVVVDRIGNLYVNVGVPSNACERDYPRRDFRGQEPCAELRTGGGIWRFAADSLGQPFGEERRVATGLRHTVALTVDSHGALWGAPHAIDHLNNWWPQAGFSREEAAMTPSETLHRIEVSGDYGFPYCMYDARVGRMVRAPAYQTSALAANCDRFAAPAAVFDAHAAPMALQFYEAGAFPARYLGGLFIALHGSLFRDPLPRTGYKVVFLPFTAGAPGRMLEDFASSGARSAGPFGTGLIRPSGLAVDSAGALLIADDTNERIWRVTWTGQ